MAKSSIAAAMLGVLALGAWSHDAFAQSRMDFKGIPFGATRADIQRTGKLWCRPDPAKLHDNLCTYFDPKLRTLAGHFAEDMDFQFFGDRLDSLRLVLDYTAYDGVREAMTQRYGKPSCDQGVRADCSWDRGGDVATLILKRGKLHAYIEAREGAQERLKRLDRAQVRTRGDI